jgi:hypothetical protein
MQRIGRLSNKEILLFSSLALAVAAASTTMILSVWDEWFALVFLGYVMFFVGGYMWLPWRGRIGYAVSFGMLFGILVPLLVHIVSAVSG